MNYIGVSDTVISYNPFAYCENEPVNSVDPYGYAKAWQQLGFKYSNSKSDKANKKKGNPPTAYNNWLTNGNRREVNGVSYTRMGVKTTLLSVTYIPKNKTESYYLSLGGNLSLLTIMSGIAGSVLDISGKSPDIGKILALVSLTNALKDLALYSDKKSFKKEMDKGKGVAILEISISSSSFGGSIVTSYRSWDGKGDLYDLLK